MKIFNTSMVSTPISVSFKKINGEFVEVLLSKGQFVYTDSSEETKSLVIQRRKGNVQTTNDEKPEDLKYYVVYPLVEKVPSPSVKISESEVVVIESVEEKKPKSPYVNLVEKDLSELETTNKGGRPKGSKNKSKRGRPKLKKPPGRPRKNQPVKQKIQVETYTNRILTEKSIGKLDPSELIGMTKHVAQDTCVERGFKTRTTMEDGKEFMITSDLRPDRINLVIENGVIIKADIG